MKTQSLYHEFNGLDPLNMNVSSKSIVNSFGLWGVWQHLGTSSVEKRVSVMLHLPK